ncbi:MAG: hypothetical protein V1724_05325 [Chloroflexota bacterium]
MRKAGILVAVGIVALFFVACGGGGGGGGETPTAAPITPTAETIKGELVQVTGNADYTMEPNIIELKVGKAYNFQMLNRGNSSYRLRVPRWDIMLFALAGADSEVSKVVVPDVAGDFDCFEDFNAVRHGMKCLVRVSP